MNTMPIKAKTRQELGLHRAPDRVIPLNLRASAQRTRKTETSEKKVPKGEDASIVIQEVVRDSLNGSGKCAFLAKAGFSSTRTVDSPPNRMKIAFYELVYSSDAPFEKAQPAREAMGVDVQEVAETMSRVFTQGTEGWDAGTSRSGQKRVVSNRLSLSAPTIPSNWTAVVRLRTLVLAFCFPTR